MAGSSRTAGSAIRILSAGVPRSVIVTQPGASAPELHAASELARWLGEIAGAPFEVRECARQAPPGAIVVGPGPVADEHFPGADLDAFGAEECLIRTGGGRLLLAGGRPRGTLYAVYRLLQDHLGVRWYAPWNTVVPRRGSIALPPLDLRARPAFEVREPFWFPAFDGDWAARNLANSTTARLEPHHGGKITYRGFVHTFYPLAPPEEHFAAHPEWYSMIDGVRKHEHAQLCCTNPQLRDFLVERVCEWLRETPDVDIVSVSQNDWFGPCDCPECRAVDEREGSRAGSLLELVNYIAERIEPEFPSVAVDTLAYQYTRTAPRHIRPRHNVIVRLCTIECDFRQPLEGPTNADFARDNREWSRLTDRLYVWDYTTDFAYYTQPHPNWDVLGPNVRFFHRHGVVGLFEQGAYQSHASEFSELRAWVLARLLWDPYQDDQALIDEFLAATYGRAARHVRAYMDWMLERSLGHYMNCFSHASSPYLDYASLEAAERFWQKAEAAVADDPDHRWAVRQGHASVWFAWLNRWTSLRREHLADRRRRQRPWPVGDSRRELAERWLQTVTGPGPEGWQPAVTVREQTFTPREFVDRLGEDPPDPVAAATWVPARGVLEIQDDLALLLTEPWHSEALPDPLATDGVAVRIPGDHGRKAFEVHLRRLGSACPIGWCTVCVWARVECEDGMPGDAPTFRAGVGFPREGHDIVEIAPALSSAAATGYRAYEIGPVDLNEALQIWVASPGDARIAAVWVDRVTVERAR